VIENLKTALKKERREGQERSHSEGTGWALPLSSAIAKGDPEAFGRFYELWFDRAYSMARSLTRRDESFCLDVVQDTMLRVVKSLRVMPNEEALARWMAKVIHTTALDHLRRETRRRRREQRASAERFSEQDGPRPPGALGVDEQIQWLQSRIQELSVEERSLLKNRFGDGKSLEETGATVGISGDAAHGRIRRILERLRAAAREMFHESL